MSIELTSDQLQATSQGPVRITDPETNQVYVVLRADVYEQMAISDDEPSMEEIALLVDKVMAEDDANDPHLDSYQQPLTYTTWWIFVCTETVLLQRLRADLSPDGFPRHLVYELRVDWEAVVDGEAPPAR